jgi:hypothetical protein
MTLHAGQEKLELFAEASELFTHIVLQLAIIYKIASSKCIFQGAKKMEVRGCKMRTVERMRENSPHNCCKMPPLRTDWCGVWHCHVEGGLVSSSCPAIPSKFIVLTSLMPAHTALH